MRRTSLALYIAISLSAAPAHAGPITWVKQMIAKLRPAPARPAPIVAAPRSPSSVLAGEAPANLAPAKVEPTKVEPRALVLELADPARRSAVTPAAARPQVSVVKPPAPTPRTYAQIEQRSHEGAPAIFTPARPVATKILYFHGAGARTKDGIIDRLAPALFAEDLQHEVISLPYDSSRADIERLIAGEKRASIIVAGHSMGGAYVVHELLQKHVDKVKAAFLINPATGAIGPQRVPTLLIRGSEDHPGSESVGHNVTRYVAKGGDHSLRFRPGMTGDKELANASAETAELVQRTAQQIKAFLDQHAPEPGSRKGS